MERTTVGRRKVLQAGGATGLLVATGVFGACARKGWLRPPILRPGPVHQRRLVMIEMAGGCDGLSMVAPTGDPNYRRLRPTTAIPAAGTHPLDEHWGYHPALAQLARQGATVVAGVGVATPDLSHFEMMYRWQSGDPDGRARPDTGFLGRLCDVLGEPGTPAVGVSLGLGATPALASKRVTTLSVDAGNEGRFPAFDDDGIDAAWLAAQRAMAHPDRADSPLLATARAGTATALRFSDAVATLPPAADGYPDSGLAAQLRVAARLLADENLGLRIVHVPMDADFDTHTGHPDRFTALMTEFDAAVAAFRADLAGRGLADRVLIAAHSEFGRRVPENDGSGLDHGAAGTALLIGPTVPGLAGEPPSLRRLDADGNVVATVPMAEFHATLADTWFGVPASEVLAGSPRPIPGVLPVLK
ncbi:DUF1501 domain-containing protein [Nocardia sp. alder85J]|uniref:DUF1501 domain-containing protein n=1 Tax=Nocardia sp. alder85J TaxID=2862949 RepID=UPI001CD209A9|nr:DUF1501 domain-containing protein [Nocardia sp. alder85J]MCX4094172.1 DUF1501 domain-containing protein [Nocardia sp. alder85J]